jgi:hypothetical protein
MRRIRFPFTPCAVCCTETCANPIAGRGLHLRAKRALEAQHQPGERSRRALHDRPCFFERIDWVVDHAGANDLAVILDMRHYEEIMTTPGEQSKRFLYTRQGVEWVEG